MKMMRVVGWRHRRSDLRQRRAARKIWSRKVHSLYAVVFLMIGVCSLTNGSQQQDAFSPRRRGMDRRPLSEGFDVSVSFMAFMCWL